MCCTYVAYKAIYHIGKDNILYSCGIFIPFLSDSMRVIMKEGDRMGHKDDVFMDVMF